MLAAVLLVHDWYPQWCCNGDGVTGDCKPVDCDAISELKDGYQFKDLHFDSSHVFPSPDKQCHVCIRDPDGKTRAPICVFIQPES